MSAEVRTVGFYCDQPACHAQVIIEGDSILDASHRVPEGWFVGWGISGGNIPVFCPLHSSEQATACHETNS